MVALPKYLCPTNDMWAALFLQTEKQLICSSMYVIMLIDNVTKLVQIILKHVALCQKLSMVIICELVV